MKNFIALCVFFLFFVVKANASSSYFNVGDNIESHETIQGNQSVIAAETLINSDIQGDLFAMGGVVEVGGEVHGKTTIISGNASLRGVFFGDVTIYSGNVTILPECVIKGKLLVFGGNIEFMGECFGTSKFLSSNLRISGTLWDKCRIYAAKIIFTSSARINAPLTYSSPIEPSVSEGAKFQTPLKQSRVHNIHWSHGRLWSQLESSPSGVSFGMNYLFSLVLGFILLRFFSRGLNASINALERSFLKSLLLGLLAMIVAPLVTIILFATLLGIPLAFTFLALCIVTLASAKIIPILWVLKKFRYRKQKKFLVLTKSATLPSKSSFALGLFAFLILVKIPFIGFLLSSLSMLIGIGSLLKSNFEGFRKSS